jgi:hypothetical protein
MVSSLEQILSYMKGFLLGTRFQQWNDALDRKDQLSSVVHVLKRRSPQLTRLENAVESSGARVMKKLRGSCSAVIRWYLSGQRYRDHSGCQPFSIIAAFHPADTSSICRSDLQT